MLNAGLPGIPRLSHLVTLNGTLSVYTPPGDELRSDPSAAPKQAV